MSKDYELYMVFKKKSICKLRIPQNAHHSNSRREDSLLSLCATACVPLSDKPLYSVRVGRF